MKPNKNIVYCTDCNRRKMLFETEKKADNFMKFNNDEIEEETGYSPERSYYCILCDGWHLTSKKGYVGLSQKEKLIEKYTQEKGIKNVENQDRSEKIVISEMPDSSLLEKHENLNLKREREEIKKKEKEDAREKKRQDLENKIKEMPDSQKDDFFFRKY